MLPVSVRVGNRRSCLLHPPWVYGHESSLLGALCPAGIAATQELVSRHGMIDSGIKCVAQPGGML